MPTGLLFNPLVIIEPLTLIEGHRITRQSRLSPRRPHPPARAHLDEPADKGGDATKGPSPQELLAASLAACVAITIEMYAERKGWDVGAIEVECDFTPAERGCPTRFELDPAAPRRPHR